MVIVDLPQPSPSPSSREPDQHQTETRKSSRLSEELTAGRETCLTAERLHPSPVKIPVAAVKLPLTPPGLPPHPVESHHRIRSETFLKSSRGPLS